MLLKIKAILTDAAICLCGLVFFSLSVNMFAIPNGIVQGGFTGISTMVNHIFPDFPVGRLIFTLNIPLFILAKLFLEKGFIAKTFLLTLGLSLFIDVGSYFIPAYEGDPMLCAIFCGIFSGLGLSLVFYTGATTGGTDIIARLLKKLRPSLSMGTLMLILDAIIITLSALVYGEIEAIMYALITVFFTSKVIDFVLYGSEHGKVMIIISDEATALTDEIMKKHSRGVTVIKAQGGYTKKEKNILWCAVRASQVRNINRSVKNIDPHAFTVICDAGQIIGEGFRN